jgi:hypothetical protein
MTWPEQLTDEDLAMAAAWRQAEKDLGITVAAPFSIATQSNVFQYAALVEKFGIREELGVVLRVMPHTFHPDQSGEIWTAAEQAGYLAVNVAPVLLVYVRNSFIEFLDGFRWCGRTEDRPPWHAAKYAPPCQ